MADSFRFQFTIVDEKNAACLRAIPAPYRSLFVEMALEAWFVSENVENAHNLCAIMKSEARRPVRFRISITDEIIIMWLRTISVRHRSLFAESALSAFMESDSGRRMFDIFSSKNKDRLLVHAKQVEKEFGKPGFKNRPAQAENKKASDTEALMKSMLEFK